MKNSLLIILLAAALLPAQARAQSAPALQEPQGSYLGVLDVGVAKLRIALEITRAADGTLAASVKSVDQGNVNVPVTSITFKEGVLRIEMSSVGGVFEGKPSADGSEITGKFTQGGQVNPLVFKRGAKAEYNRPQNPKKPYPYDELEVAYENKKAGIKLAGTLTLPRGKEAVPAVLLITGSGLQDRDETVANHKPFLVLADHLTRRGIAVLRVDDRGAGGSTGNFATATTEDFAGDVLAGVEFLKTRKEINPKQIGLIGHSEGGIVAPIAASKSADVAFIVLMAGTGLTGEEILYLQGALISRAAGASEKAIAKQRENQQRMFTIIQQEKDAAVAEKRLREEVDKMLAEISEEDKKAAGLSKASMEAQIGRVLSPWFRYFVTYDPKPALRQVKVPVLAINGERDLQVPAKENLSAIEAALKEGGNKDYTIKSLPELNHLFQTSKTGAISEYAQIEETISPAVLELISAWILERTAKR